MPGFQGIFNYSSKALRLGAGAPYASDVGTCAKKNNLGC